MATSAESNGSQKFIEEQRELYGRFLAIEKVISKIAVGVADIHAIYKGMPLYAESKWINKFTLVNAKKFESIQIHYLKKHATAGAVCIGLLLNDGPAKYIDWTEIPEEGRITSEQFIQAKLFNFENLREVWLWKLMRQYE